MNEIAMKAFKSEILYGDVTIQRLIVKKGLSRFSRELNRLKETKMIYGGCLEPKLQA